MSGKFLLPCIPLFILMLPGSTGLYLCMRLQYGMLNPNCIRSWLCFIFDSELLAQ